LVPAESRIRLQSCFLEIQKSNLRLTAELIRILKELEANSIPVICLRGPVLAELLYHHPALRLYSDLDLLIHQEDLGRARHLLGKMGYQRDYLGTPRQEEIYLKWQCEDHHTHDDSGVPVELHWNVLPRHYRFHFHLDRAWQEIQKVSVQGYSCPTLRPEEYLLILCTHAHKHGWNRLNQIADLAQLIRDNPDLPWESIYREAGQSDGLRPLQSGVSLALELFELNLSEPARGLIRKDARFRHAVKSLIAEPVGADAGVTWKTLSPRSRIHFCDRWSNRVLGFLQYILIPTTPDWKMIRLSDRWHFLYYFLRPLRLLIRSSIG
jgi:hypothetical protein